MPTPIKNLECFMLIWMAQLTLETRSFPAPGADRGAAHPGYQIFLFCTNNSSKSPAEYVKKLEKLRVLGDDAFAYHDIRRCDDPLSQNAFSKTEGLFIGHACLEEQFRQAGITLLTPNAPQEPMLL